MKSICLVALTLCAANSVFSQQPRAEAAERVANFFHALASEVQILARACGKSDVHHLEPEDLRALSLEASMITGLPLAGTNRAFGGRTPLSVVVNSVVILLAATVLFPLLAYIPRAALSATIMVVAIQHIQPWTWQLAGRLFAPGTPQREVKPKDDDADFDPTGKAEKDAYKPDAAPQSPAPH